MATYHSLLIPQNVEHLLTIYSTFQAACLEDWCSLYLPFLLAFPSALPMEGSGLPSQHTGEPGPVLPSFPDIAWSITFSQWVLLNSPLHGGTSQCLCQSWQKKDKDKESFPWAASPLHCVVQHAKFTGEGNLPVLPMGPALGRGLNAPMGEKSDEGESVLRH